jgi:hypothetical protein
MSSPCFLKRVFSARVLLSWLLLVYFSENTATAHKSAHKRCRTKGWRQRTRAPKGLAHKSAHKREHKNAHKDAHKHASGSNKVSWEFGRGGPRLFVVLLCLCCACVTGATNKPEAGTRARTKMRTSMRVGQDAHKSTYYGSRE